MFPLTRKKILLAGLGMILLGVLGFIVLINPNNPLTRFFSAEIAISDAKVIIGPYPNKTDFRLLQKNGVTTIVSLLDPRLPYERILLERERETAKDHGIEVLNFPMASIFGQPLGGDYDQRAVNAVEAVAKAPGKVYMHCYLGIHRAKRVDDLLRVKGIITGQYLVRQGKRDADSLLLDQAEKEFNQGQYQAALDVLKQIRDPELAARLLQGWTFYRLGDTRNARLVFDSILQSAPNNVDARTGLGYSAMREGAHEDAERNFKTVLQGSPKDAASLAGLGLLYYRQGRHEDAAKYLQAALDVNPRDGEVRRILNRISPSAARQAKPPM